MSRSVLAAALLCCAIPVAACGGSADGGWTHAEPVPLSEPPDDGLAEPPDPQDDSPQGPRIEVEALLEYEGPAPTLGLPARAGDRVALPVVANDTARGNPNLTLRIVTIGSGDVVWEKVVLTPQEFADAESPEALRAMVEPRAAEARARLDEGDYEPLTAVYVPETPGDGTVEATGAGVFVDWNPDTRIVRARADDESLLARVEVEPAPPVEEGEACPEAHAPRLAGAWVDAPDGVMVLRIAFVGNDACWQPSDRWLVVPLGTGTEEEEPPDDPDGA